MRPDLRRADLDSRRFFKAEHRLQSALFKVDAKTRRHIDGVMALLHEQGARLRRKEIFALGAKTRKIKRPIMFNGHELGSAESMTFYEGYASTHPGFENPYRARNI